MKLRWMAIVVFAWLWAAAARAAAPIEVELATQQGLQITAPREWLQLFAAIGIDNVRIRGAQAGEAPAVEKIGAEARPRYRVLGILTARNQLQLPGAMFGRGDRARIKDYLDQLAADGAESLTAAKGRYGLTSKELAATFADFTQPINFETTGQAPRAILDRLRGNLAHEFLLDAKADAALRAAKPFEDNLQGVSTGTGLAMLLRNCGLVLRPEKSRGKPLAYRIAVADADAVAQSTLGKEADESLTNWPIGWEPDVAPVKLAPSLFEQLNAEIDGYTLAETLSAIGPRVRIPIFLDRALLSSRRIDPASVQVKLPKIRTTYQQLLGRVLAQSQLGTSLRVDEAGRPFVWITR